ncbi:unnamed protein product [Cyclocybe aegerita]|uniref:Uncharacterized protein n=1 Tax=Cyclocybe aegerita TaxID=1973307 RepID=A0A8S0WFQ3_CYCAE|nr:unnamed protein product [Cyclocybe aegerita]
MYGAVSWFERLRTVFILVPLPFVSLSRLLSPFLASEKHKTWRCVLTDACFSYIPSSICVKAERRGHDTECLRDMGGEERRGGGTYCLPLQDFAATFCKDAIDNVEKTTETKVGLVPLTYSLIPEAYVPNQLPKLIKAIHYLLQQGVYPSNIHLAGRALVLQLLSHIRVHHPIYLSQAPEGECDGLEGVVLCVFISIGEYECLRRRQGYWTVVQGRFRDNGRTNEGVHDDQYLDVMAGEKRPGELTMKINE